MPTIWLFLYRLLNHHWFRRRVEASHRRYTTTCSVLVLWLRFAQYLVLGLGRGRWLSLMMVFTMWNVFCLMRLLTLRKASLNYLMLLLPSAKPALRPTWEVYSLLDWISMRRIVLLTLVYYSCISRYWYLGQRWHCPNISTMLTDYFSWWLLLTLLILETLWWFVLPLGILSWRETHLNLLNILRWTSRINFVDQTRVFIAFIDLYGHLSRILVMGHVMMLDEIKIFTKSLDLYFKLSLAFLLLERKLL